MNLLSEAPPNRTIEGQVFRFVHYLDFTKGGSLYEVYMGVDTGELRMFLTKRERERINTSPSPVARRINLP
jgi:hypothetical protein